MRKPYLALLALAVTIPAFLGANAWQANRCGVLRSEIRRLERAQESLVEENKTVAAEIANLLAVDRLERDAMERLGMARMRPEDVTLIIVGGDPLGQ